MNEKYPGFVVSVIGYVLADDGRVLLMRHPERGWEQPGGAIERNEDAVGALVREVREETGHLVEVTSFVGMYFDHNQQTIVLNFRCRPVGGAAVRIADGEAAWFWEEEVVDLIASEPARSRLVDVRSRVDDIVCRGFLSNPYTVTSESVWPRHS